MDILEGQLLPYGVLVLKIGLAVLMLAAGIHALVFDPAIWASYIAPQAVSFLPFSVTGFMMVIAVLEVIAGVAILVPMAEGYGSLLASLLLVGITFNVLIGGASTDIIIRDIGLSFYAVGCTLLLWE